MSISICLGPDELRIIGHSINWQLNVPYEHTLPPRLSEREMETLAKLFVDLSDLNRLCLSGVESVVVEIGEPYLCSESRLRLPQTSFRLMTEAVASFFEELRSSPAELEIVTGMPPSRTAELLSELHAGLVTTG